MSGEYYGRENHTKFYNDYEIASLQPNNEKYAQAHRLNGIEEQLEVAENRCSTLNDQLDHMKKFYGVKKVVSSAKSRKMSSLTSNNKFSSDDNLSVASSTGSGYHKKCPQKRSPQPSGATDNSGTAVRTINNILNGITNSVNRLSELHVQLSDSSRSRPAATNMSPKRYYNDASSNLSLPGQQNDQRKQIPLMNPATNLHGTISSTKSITGKNRSLKKRFKDSKIAKRQSSLLTIKKNIKVDKIPKISKPVAKLVEIFHNKEAKSSDSDEFHINKKSHHINCEGDHIDTITDIPLLQLENCNGNNDLNAHSKRLCRGLMTGDYYDPPEAPRVLMNCSQKSYQLPTIASRMKQSMVNTLISANTIANSGPRTKKAIPFCPAITASPSHNIGINIQQVMNILRNRQPINGISPTLAHNIGLAADRLNKPLSTLVSTIGSKTCTFGRPQHCPLSKCTLNFQQLQDLAKGIPEETQEEVDGEDSPDIKNIVITGPSGEMEIKNKNVPYWAVESNKLTECTCVPQSGPDINYIVNKIKKAASGKMITSQISVGQKPPSIVNRWNLNPKALKRPHTTKSKEIPKPLLQVDKTVSNYPINGKEKKLKEVLTQLHDEFERLNTRYEDLSKNNQPSDEKTAKEMAQLEEELNKKEGEITTVMSLCTEVMALKNQLKGLKRNSSQCSIAQESKGTPTTASLNDYSNSQAAFHLTKLLKKIQTYQLQYKTGVDD